MDVLGSSDGVAALSGCSGRLKRGMLLLERVRKLNESRVHGSRPLVATRQSALIARRPQVGRFRLSSWLSSMQPSRSGEGVGTSMCCRGVQLAGIFSRAKQCGRRCETLTASCVAPAMRHGRSAGLGRAEQVSLPSPRPHRGMQAARTRGGVGGQRGCWLRGWWVLDAGSSVCVSAAIGNKSTLHATSARGWASDPRPCWCCWCWLLLRRDSCWRWLAGGTHRAWHGMGMGRPRPAARRHLAGHVTCMLRRAGVQACRCAGVVP